MQKEPVLVVLAAGLGSRYGGLKQITPVGATGEKLLDYSLYDAKMVGFQKAVFVIREELLEEFETEVFAQMRPFMEIEYVFQKQDDIPEGFSVPDGRVKPWGTAHAALCAARAIDGAPFAVVNADDFYGREAFHTIYHFLKSARDGEKMKFAMVGYHLENTVTDNGYVSRGICKIEERKLVSVTERLHIEKRPDGGIAYTEDNGETWVRLPDNTTVSMNLFGFTPGVTAEMEKRFVGFFRDEVPQDPMKKEFLLPFIVNDMIEEGIAEVSVLSSTERWYGVTYQEDRPMVVEGIRELTKQGVYPSPLWQ